MNSHLKDIAMNEFDDDIQTYHEYIEQGLDHKQAMGLLYDKAKDKIKSKKIKHAKYLDGDI